MDMRIAGGVGGCSSRYGISGAGGGCGYGYGCGLYDISMVDRMMLKFRPIAPKPVSSGYGCGAVNDGKTGGAGKRRYVRVKSNNKRNIDKNINKKRKVLTTSPEIVSAGGGDHVVVTLPLMPETPDRKEKSAVINKIVSPTTTTWLSFTKNNHLESIISPSTAERRRPTVSFVTVERVTKTRVDCTAGLVDWREMERDTCPRFISDGGDRVVWTNKAYREMAGGGRDDEEVMVVLVRKKLEGSWPAEFTCHVRVTWGSGVISSSNSAVTVPCDTWILKDGSGGYAWRLDVKAALSLGR